MRRETVSDKTGSESESVTFVVKDHPMSLGRALAYLLLFVILAVGVLSALGVWIRLFWISWVFGG